MNPTRLLKITATLFGTALLALAACGGDEAADTVPRDEEFDRAFIDAMVPHHESAIEMAQAAKEAGLSQPDLVKVADDILATQQDEIDQMKDWRDEWFGSSTIDPDGGEGIGLSRTEMGMDMEHDVGMLRDSTDVNTDFAQMMIPHHEGAITMAELAKERAGHDELKELADAIIEAQQREIDVMRPHASGEHHG
jgi:uncharacterized protein (DUF305 family)